MENYGIGEYTENKAKAISVPLRRQERAVALEDLGLSVIEKIRRQVDGVRTYKLRRVSRDRYKEIIETQLVVNNSIAALAAGTLYTACKEKSVPVALEDLRDASRWYTDNDGSRRYNRLVIEDSEKLIDSSQEIASFGRYMTDIESIHSAYNQIRDELDLSYPPIDPEKFVSRYCDNLNTNSSFETTAQVTRKQVQETIFSGRPPSTFAAGVIWFTAKFVNAGHRENGEAITLNDIASVSSKSVSAIGETATEIEETVDALDLGKSGPALDL